MLIHKLEPETAHNLAINFLKFFPRLATLKTINNNYVNLQQKLWNIDFTSPIGMAAGFDKNAEIPLTLQKFGFGFVECGTVTPRSQSGNDKPRLFRLTEDKAIINRLGFNNLGAQNFEYNVTSVLSQLSIPLGINIGKNRDSSDDVADYLELLRRFYDYASYITVNISSPNTKNLRDIQNEDKLDLFLQQIMLQKNQLKETRHKNVPILLKIAPDLDLEQQEKIAEIVTKHQVDGIIISNTTIDRQFNLQNKNAQQQGGLSGKPLFAKSNLVLKNFYKLTQGKIPLIGVGGISSASDAYEKIKSGASLVQIYSAFIYEGFGLVEKIKEELSEMVRKDGLKNVSEAVGKMVN